MGAFTSFDSVTGGAQNPLTLNRYLYANANPATLIDPDGHWAHQDAGCPVQYCGDFWEQVGNRKGDEALLAAARSAQEEGLFSDDPVTVDVNLTLEEGRYGLYFVDDNGAMWSEDVQSYIDACTPSATPGRDTTNFEGSECAAAMKTAALYDELENGPGLSDSEKLHMILGGTGIVNPLGDAADAVVYASELDPINALISLVSVIPVGDVLKVLRTAKKVDQAAKALDDVKDLAGLTKLVKHHTIPREILDKYLPTLPGGSKIAANRLIRGMKGKPNMWAIPEDLHIRIHAGSGGGLYNDAWKGALDSASAQAKAQGREIDVLDVLNIRDELAAQFGISGYRP